MEIEISGLLDKEYTVFNTKYYFDKEGKQGRDIDIHAVPHKDYGYEDLKPLHLRIDIAIECKKSETHTWVFFTRPYEFLSALSFSGQYETSVPRVSTDSFDWLIRKCLKPHYRKFERIAIAYDEIKKKKYGSSRRDIFEAVHQLLKFTCYEIHESFIRRSKLTDLPPEHELIFVFFPILVFDGDMFEVTFDSGKPRLKRRNHILVSTHYRCPYCQEVRSFMVDVVHRSHFSEFMKILDTDYYEMTENILKNRDGLVKKAKETRIKFLEKSVRFSVEK